MWGLAAIGALAGAFWAYAAWMDRQFPIREAPPWEPR